MRASEGAISPASAAGAWQASLSWLPGYPFPLPAGQLPPGRGGREFGGKLARWFGIST